MTPPERAAPGEDPGSTSILLVDDKPGNLLALEGILAPLGQRLVRAASGAEALRQVLAQDFAAILLDVRMPIMDGFEVAAMIRSRGRSRHTPILFLTAHAASEIQVFNGYASGAVDFLTRPFHPDILRSKVQVFVELAKHAQALSALNQKLERLNAELLAANKGLDAFSTAVSHDLRAPLRQVEGFLGLLEGRMRHGENDEGHAYLANARAAARRMDLLIEGLLGLAGLSRSAWVRLPVDLNEVLASVAAEVQAGLKDRVVEWNLGPLPTIQGDPSLLRAAFLNLLDNAAKFTAHRERARVEVGSLPAPPGEVRVFVRDNGAGFDPAQAGHLFEVFRRFHSQDQFEGTGVGLANVHRIVSQHQGRIWAEGRPGEGATFHLAFPRGAVP